MPNTKQPEQKQWWKSGDVIKIQATHWKTFLIGIKLGYLLGKITKNETTRTK